MSSTHAIIVVEDDASMTQAIERLLSAAGWKVATFPSAEALLDSGAATTADGFIFDIQLPGLSGFALHGKLRAAGVEAPVIYITAYDLPAAREQAEHSGAKGYFTKPFVGQKLIETLTRHCAAAHRSTSA